MNLLAAKLYDPAVAVSKATSSLLAMTAFDTTNLRLAVTVPAHGMVRFRIVATVTGATTMPVIYLGVLNGSTVVARCSPTDFPGTANAATQTVPAMVDFVVTGLTPGSTNFDAAYGVEVVVASTNIKYGGPNNTTTNDAWGAIQFEAWDPQPMTANATLAVDASGRVDVSKVSGTAQTARDLGAQLDAAVTTRAPSSTAVSNVDYTAARAAKLDNLDATISSRSSYAGGDTAGTTTLLGRVTATRAGLLDNLDAAVSSRLATSGYTAPPSAVAIRAEIDANSAGLAAIFARTDVATSSRLAAASYTAPDNAGVAAVKAKTDSLTFTVPQKLDVNLLVVNGVTVGGAGTPASPWGPA